MEEGKAIAELRREFKAIPWAQFMRIVRTEWGKGMLRLRKKLAVADEAAIRKAAEQEAEFALLIESIRLSETHRQLKITAPAGVDLGHLQALIVYGFLTPGRQEHFLESHQGPFEKFQQAVHAKLGEEFSQEQFTQAWSALSCNGVLLTRKKGTGTAYSLTLKPGHHGVTAWGKQVITASRELLQRYK